MKMRIADYLMNRIYDAGAKHVFFVPGTGCMFLTDALAKKEELTAISVHHEQAAGMAALSYAKYNETFGACLVSTGCGGTNTVTAVLHAWQDNVPCIFISGQASRNQTIRNSHVPLRQFGRQEADIVSIVESITKYAVMINEPEDIAYEIDKAIYYATTGRKGPVWIDVPMDMQNYIIEIEGLRRFEIPAEEKSPELNIKDKELILSYLKKAKRPMLLLGNGIRLGGAVDLCREFVEKYKIPVAYTRLGHDLIETDNPLSIGMVGMLGASRAGNFAVANSDLLICIGSRLSIDTTGYEYNKFAREAKIIVVDIDENEHRKGTVKINHFVHSNVKSFFSELLEEDFSVDYSDWAEKCLHWKNIFPMVREEYKQGDRINMYYFVNELSKVLPKNSTVLSDAGNAFFIVSPTINIKNGQRSITSGGQAEMGYVLPGAIGVAYASNDPVIAITGDGAIMMNIQELATLAYQNLPVKLCVMNNNGYSSIRYLQDSAFRGRQLGCDPSTGIGFPKFKAVAEAFGLTYVCIEESDNLQEKISDMLAIQGPVFCEVMCVEEQEFLTVSTALNSKKRMVTRPLEDQAPFLDREVFLREMIIPPLD